LYVAVDENHLDVAKVLIAKGADVNAKGNNGKTALHSAVKNRNKDMVQLLLDKGAEVDFFAAAALGRMDRMRALLDANPALVSAQGDKGWSPLHMAAVGGSREAAELLLAKGADANATDSDGMTPLHVANKAVAELLIAKKANVNSWSRDNADLWYDDGVHPAGQWTPLHRAAFEGRTEVAEVLIAAGAAINERDADGATPLYLTAQRGQSGVAAALLAAGADVGIRTKHGATPLYIASLRGHAAVARLLIANKADVNAKTNDSFRYTPLYRAAEGGHKDVVELLLASGADVNAVDALGRTALQMVAERGDPEVAAVLRAYVAKASGSSGQVAKSPADNKAFFTAISNSELAVVRAGIESHPDWLEATTPLGVTPLEVAAASGDKDMVEFLLGKGAAVNVQNAAALWAAVTTGHTDTMRLLIAKGANVNAKGPGGQVPLHLAVMMGKKDVAELLIASGADLNIRTTQGSPPFQLPAGVTPLYLAAGFGRLDLVTLLLAKGADVNVKDEKGGTALDIAIKTKHKEIADLLLKHGATPK
jgi:cytohesin